MSRARWRHRSAVATATAAASSLRTSENQLCLIDGHALWCHYTRSAERADYVLDQYRIHAETDAAAAAAHARQSTARVVARKCSQPAKEKSHSRFFLFFSVFPTVYFSHTYKITYINLFLFYDIHITYRV